VCGFAIKLTHSALCELAALGRMWLKRPRCCALCAAHPVLAVEVVVACVG